MVYQTPLAVSKATVLDAVGIFCVGRLVLFFAAKALVSSFVFYHY